MALKFTVESFLNLVRQSRLVDADRLEQAVAALPAGGDSQSVADALVASGELTSWQAEKLLKGKHKGFFLGKYRLQSLLGKGGMSSVYLAEHVLMRRRCAIKVLPHKKVNDSSYLERFHREAQAVASLDHPNIVRAYDVDREVDGTTEIHFLVMEYVEGHSLQELVNDEGARGFREVADFIRQSANGLTHAHEAGLVHRDVKPGNLLVDTEGVVKILDLGLARFFEEEDENPITLRHDERVLGTADYLAPEQALDSHKVDARADIYSLGCTMYFLLTGRPPFNEGTLAQRLMWHQTKDPAAISESRSDVPAQLSEIVSRMMIKDPDDRFQTANQVADQLGAWLGDGETPRSQAPVAQAIPVAKPAEPVAPVAAVVESATPAVDELVTAETSETAMGAVSETEPIASDDPDLADFLSAVGEGSPIAPPAPGGESSEPDPAVVSDSDPPPVAAAVEAPSSPAPPDKVAWPDSESDASPPPAVIPATGDPDGGFPELDMSAAVTSPRARSRDRTASGRGGGSGRGLKIGLAVGGVVLVIAVAMMIFGGPGGGDNPGENPGGGSAGGKTAGGKTAGGKTTGGGNGGGDTQAPPAKKARKAKKTLQVGADAEFKTIGAALAYIREHRDDYARTTRRIQVTIEVLGGQTYSESIEIDNKNQQWPTGIEIIGTGINPVIAPPGQKPGIRLNEVGHIHIKGFQIDVKGNRTGVMLSGAQKQVLLEDLVISGFTEAGIDAQGAFGSPSVDKLQLTGLRLTSGGAEAVGMKLSRKGVFDTAYVEIYKCRMIGPQRAGIELTDNATNLTLRESVITVAEDAAVLFSGENRQWKNVSIRNNTFFQIKRGGLVFEHMPVDSSDNVSIRHNLFFEVRGPECKVKNKYADLQFSQMVAAGIFENWSTRSEEADREDGERELMLPGLAAQRGVKVEFSSTDPLAADFLEPRAGTLPRRGPGNAKDPAFIGAQPFRQR